MTDILERLQVLHVQMRISQRTGDGGVASIARDAADEIKRLRMQLMTLERLMEGHFEMQRRWDSERIVTKTRKVKSDSKIPRAQNT